MNNAYNHSITKGKLANRYFITICLIGFVYNFAMNVINNSISLYIINLGGTTALAGQIAIPFAICAILARFVAAYTTDYVGRRVTMAVGCAVFALTVYLFGAVSAIPLLFVFRGMMGIGFSLANTAGSASTADTAPPEKVGTAMGMFYLPSALSLALCGTIVIAFSSSGKYTELFTLIAAVLFIGVLLSISCNYEKHVNVKAERSENLQKGIHKFFYIRALPAALLAFIACVAMCIVTGFILLYAERAEISNSALFFTVSAAVMLTCNLLSPRLAARFGRVRVMLVCCLVFSAGGVGLGVTGNVAFYYVLACGYGAVFGGCFPLFLAMALDGVEPSRRGAASGTVLVANDIGVGAGQALWGFFINQSGFSFTFITGGIIIMLVPILAYVITGARRTRNVEGGSVVNE